MVEMSFDDLFVRFWWLIFPLFGMIWAFVELTQSGRRSKQAMDVIKSLVEQGKDPPVELLDIAAGDRSDNSSGWDRAQTPAAAVVVNTALAVGFGLASRFANNSNTQEVFFVLAAVFGVIALGFFFIAMFGPRPK
ncbi:MAG: hypothetical protein HOP13_02750 [Alphaproteobacteria bacterium]|nr:hypothetical protein [Alphaproteobacteria bacterium]